MVFLADEDVSDGWSGRESVAAASDSGGVGKCGEVRSPCFYVSILASRSRLSRQSITYLGVLLVFRTCLLCQMPMQCQNRVCSIFVLLVDPQKADAATLQLPRRRERTRRSPMTRQSPRPTEPTLMALTMTPTMMPTRTKQQAGSNR
jgi:hypothetical protein